MYEICAHHPEVADRIRAEAAAVLGPPPPPRGRDAAMEAVTYEQLAALRYTAAVLNETLR